MRRKSARCDEPRELRIAAYMRVSTQHQATEGDSLEAQKNDILKFIKLKSEYSGWTIASVEFYEDAGRSAKDQNRPQLQRLKRDIVEGRIDKVVCFKLDRITRSMKDFIDLWEFFNQHGVSVFSIREDFDTSTAMGEAIAAHHGVRGDGTSDDRRTDHRGHA